jgi:hypothetical protein
MIDTGLRLPSHTEPRRSGCVWMSALELLESLARVGRAAAGPGDRDTAAFLSKQRTLTVTAEAHCCGRAGRFPGMQ